MHRQTNDITRQALTCWHATLGNREMPVGSLLMHRLRVINRGRNALCFQRRRKLVTVEACGHPDGVLRPHRYIATRNARDGNNVAEAFRVLLGNLVSRGYFLLEDL